MMTMVLEGGPYEDARSTLAQLLMQAPSLAALGLPEGNVFQADTLESPDTKPFIVVRWGDNEVKIGDSWVDPVDLWVYDDLGDYTRATAIAKEAARYLVQECIHATTTTGRISQFVDRGIGGDLADDGFQAVVKPYRLGAVGNGS
jgi:hypothetical protein